MCYLKVGYKQPISSFLSSLRLDFFLILIVSPASDGTAIVFEALIGSLL